LERKEEESGRKVVFES